jgi:hypothetical protein
LTPRRAAAAWAGPLLIVIAVLIVLRDFAFGGLIGIQHVDPLAYWMPTHCALGESLRAGMVPAWNPSALAGAPFAADPQSGWMYLPVMALYTALPCEWALPLFIVLQPILAGLALYWFLRIEGLSRPAATVGGLALALGIAGSRVAVTVPFSGALAWTAVTLACAARLVRTVTPRGRLGWTTAMALAWGQIAGAHMTHGLVIGTLALAAYLVVALRRDIRAGRRTARSALASSAVLLVALPLVNAAILLPRLAYAPRTSVAMGYRGMEVLAARLAGIPAPDVGAGAGSAPSWALTFASSPGAYLGAATLLLSAAAFRSGRLRPLATAMGVLAGVSYVLSLNAVAGVAARTLIDVPLVDIYVHEPNRFRYGLLLCLPILGALGVDAWRETRGRRDRLLLLAPAVALWFVLPPIVGVAAARLALPLAAAAVTLVVLAAMLHRPGSAAAVPALLAVEVLVSALMGQRLATEYVSTGTLPPTTQGPFTPLLTPTVAASAYVRAGPIEEALAGERGRFLGWAPSLIGERGYLEDQQPAYWPLLVNQRGMLFGLEDVQGYNPTQLATTWTYLRAVEPKDIKYNAGVYVDPPKAALDLLQVHAFVTATGRRPAPGETVLATDGRWTAYRRADPPSRATVFTQWAVRDHDAALRAVARPSFDPDAELVLEETPGSSAGIPSAGGRATYTATSPSTARVDVQTDTDSVVLIRNVHDVHWRATVDGRPARLLRADYLMQAVKVPQGSHVIELRYEDPWIGRGMVASAVVLGGLAVAALVRRRRPRPPGQQPSEAD